MDESSRDGTTSVLFVCQRCLQPLKLPPHLTNSESLEQLLSGKGGDGAGSAVLQEQRPAGLPAPLHSHRTIRAATAEPNVKVSTQSSSLYQNTQTAKKLFDLHSETTDTDHPLCEECTDGLLDELDLRLREAEQESKQCSEFLKQFSEGEGAEDTEAAIKSVQLELEKVEAEEADLVETLRSIEDERSKVQGELAKQTMEATTLDEEEARHWKEYYEYQRRVNEFYEEQQGVEHQYQQSYEQLERLKKTNVFNDAFHIWHDGHFGTINTFRLGRLPSVPVEWNEINAAWGQTVLLLHTMAFRLNFRFSRYRLIPGGSHSHLERIDDSARELPLYGSGGFKLFWDSKFDQAMVAFLDCLQQFKEHVESQDKHFKLPYRISKDKIGDSNGELCIRIQGNHEETWTKALKFMLTNLKWCLAWVCKQAP